MKLKCLILACALLSSFSVFAQAKSFTIGVEALDYTPHYSGVGPEYSGFARDLLDSFAKEKGYTFSYKALPIRRLNESYLSGEIDFRYPDHQTWGGDLKEGKKIIYSNSVDKYIDGVVVLPANKGKGNEALKTLGTISGFTAWPLNDQIKAGKIKVNFSTEFDGLLKMTIEGRNDGAYGNIEVIDYYLSKKMGKAGALVFDEKIPHTKGDYLLATVKHENVIKEFNEFLKAKAKMIKELRAKHGLK